MDVYVVIDEGCQECGVGSVPIGIFATEAEAVAATDARQSETGGWRDAGQTVCDWYRMALPDGIVVG